MKISMTAFTAFEILCEVFLKQTSIFCDELPSILTSEYFYFALNEYLSDTLGRVTDFEEHNHMTAEALAIVFSPNLLRAPQNDFIMILNNMGLTHKLVKAFITHVSIFIEFSVAKTQNMCSSTPSSTRLILKLRPRYLLRMN